MAELEMLETSDTDSKYWPRNVRKPNYADEELENLQELSWDMWSKPQALTSHQCDSFLWNLSVAPSGDVVVVEGPPSGGKWLTVYTQEGLKKHQLQPPPNFRKWPWFPWDVGVLDNGHLVISEEQSRQVQLYDKNGMFARTLVKMKGSPAGISVNSKNQIVISDLQNKSISVYDVYGKQLFCSKKPSSLPRLLCPLRITASVTDNKVLVSDCWLNCIKVFDPQCNFLYQIGSHGSRDCQFLCPAGITTNQEGCIFVADELNHRIQVISPFGQVNSFLVTDCDGLQHPRAVALDTNENLIIGEWSGVVKRFQYMQ